MALILAIVKNPFSNESWPIVSLLFYFFSLMIPIFTFLLFLANDFLSSDFMNPRRVYVTAMEKLWNARPKIKKITVQFEDGITTYLEGEEAQEWGKVAFFKTNGIFECGKFPTNWKKKIQ